MTRSFLFALLMTPQIACGAVPRLFQEKDFTAASFAEAVNYFVAIGEDATVRELQGLADSSANPLGKSSVDERIGWMCRVLFRANAYEPLRPPFFGKVTMFPPNIVPDKSWPLYPVALSRSTYFILGEGYTLAGVAEDPKDYIKYCRQTGVFRKKPIAVPTKAQAIKAAAALRQSASWKAVKWTDSGPSWSYTISEGWVWKFIQNQAESI